MVRGFAGGFADINRRLGQFENSLYQREYRDSAGDSGGDYYAEVWAVRVPQFVLWDDDRALGDARSDNGLVPVIAVCQLAEFVRVFWAGGYDYCHSAQYVLFGFRGGDCAISAGEYGQDAGRGGGGFGGAPLAGVAGCDPARYIARVAIGVVVGVHAVLG